MMPPPMAAAPEMPAMPVVPPPPLPTPGLAARERFQLAINQLQQGDATHAAVELKAYLAEVPNSAPAKNMLTQIETPIEMLYPLENFTVQLGRDETLSSLSGLYLGDVLGFYGLARYNNIENPSRVVAGQNIRIPRTAQTLAAQATRVSMQQQASVTVPFLARFRLTPRRRSHAQNQPPAMLPMSATRNGIQPYLPISAMSMWRPFFRYSGNQKM